MLIKSDRQNGVYAAEGIWLNSHALAANNEHIAQTHGMLAVPVRYFATWAAAEGRLKL